MQNCGIPPTNTMALYLKKKKSSQYHGVNMSVYGPYLATVDNVLALTSQSGSRTWKLCAA